MLAGAVGASGIKRAPTEAVGGEDAGSAGDHGDGEGGRAAIGIEDGERVGAGLRASGDLCFEECVCFRIGREGFAVPEKSGGGESGAFDAEASAGGQGAAGIIERLVAGRIGEAVGHNGGRLGG